MRIKEIITELFNQPVPFTWVEQRAFSAVANFKVGDIPYRFTAHENDPGKWEVLFGIDRSYAKQHGLSQYGVTGTGNASIIMATVVNIMKEFLDAYLHKIQDLTFSADEESRQKLYARMIRRLLPGWEIKQEGGYFFTVSRPDNSNTTSV